MDIVLRLRELRRARGLTQEEAAQRAQLGMKTLSSFESGARTDSMKLSQLLRLLDAYNIAPAQFFDESIDPGDLASGSDPTELAPLVYVVREIPASSRQAFIQQLAATIRSARAVGDLV